MRKKIILMGFLFVALVVSCDNHVHIWDDGVVTNEPTCTEIGTKTFTCTECGATKNTDIPANGHSYNDGVITDDPTCTEKGTKTFTCSACGDSYDIDIPANGHSYNDGVITANPTCTEKGTKTFTCSVCGDSYDTDIPANGHSFVGITCENCGEHSVPVSEVGTQYTTTDGLLLTLNSLTHTIQNGYNKYSINYTESNNTEGSIIGPGNFKIIYMENGVFDSSFQTGAFNNFYYGDTRTRSYTWTLTSTQTIVCVEYLPNSLSSEYIFSDTPTDALLNWTL